MANLSVRQALSDKELLFRSIPDAIPSWNIRNSPVQSINSLSYTEREVFKFLLIAQSAYKSIFIAQATIASKLKVTREWVNRVIRKLCDLGMMTKVKRYDQSSLYRVSSFFFQPEIKYQLQQLFIRVAYLPLKKLFPFWCGKNVVNKSLSNPVHIKDTKDIYFIDRAELPSGERATAHHPSISSIDNSQSSVLFTTLESSPHTYACARDESDPGMGVYKAPQREMFIAKPTPECKRHDYYGRTAVGWIQRQKVCIGLPSCSVTNEDFFRQPRSITIDEVDFPVPTTLAPAITASVDQLQSSRDVLASFGGGILTQSYHKEQVEPKTLSEDNWWDRLDPNSVEECEF